jgi:glycosyltransferase involved in cell wall biosynthesis
MIGASLQRDGIFLFCAAPFRETGGVQTVALGLAGHLRERGMHVVDAWPDCDEAPGRLRLRLMADLAGGGVKRTRTFLRAVRDCFGLMWRLSRIRPECVNVHYIRGEVIYFVLLKYLFRYRLVLSFHGADLPPENGVLRRVLPTYFRAADQVTVVSQSLQALVGKYGGPQETQLIRNGVDLDFWSPPGEWVAKRKHPVIVAVGRLEPVKGFDVLIDAMASASLADARLVVAGQGSQEAALRRQCDRLGLAHRVAFVGRLGPEALRDQYRHSDAFALSSRSEAMPLALIEAMACGLPVVATRVGEVPEIVEPAFGKTVETEDPDALADALSKILQPGFAGQARRAARQRSEAFSAETSYAAYHKAMVG